MAEQIHTHTKRTDNLGLLKSFRGPWDYDERTADSDVVYLDIVEPVLLRDHTDTWDYGSVKERIESNNAAMGDKYSQILQRVSENQRSIMEAMRDLTVNALIRFTGVLETRDMTAGSRITRQLNPEDIEDKLRMGA
jgi:hypothetical protein